MEGVNHIDIIQISSSSLISQVYRVVKGQIPNREGFKLGVARCDTLDLVVVEVGHTGCQLT